MRGGGGGGGESGEERKSKRNMQRLTVNFGYDLKNNLQLTLPTYVIHSVVLITMMMMKTLS